MRIGVVGPFLSERSGGITASLSALSMSMSDVPGIQVSIFGLRDGRAETGGLVRSPVSCSESESYGPRAFGFSPGLTQTLRQFGADVMHLHGLWMYSSIAVRAVAKGKRKYIVSPHGMLDPWALKNSSWKKRFASILYERGNLERAGCIHALCVQEMEAIRSFGLNNPVCIIPNGVYLPSDRPFRSEASLRSATPTTEKTLLYLGRLHPKKNLEPLLRAWASSLRDHSRVREWKLSIVGWDQGQYVSRLRAVCQELEIETTVNFLGPKYAVEKDELLRNADALILPSLSEGLPMAVLEAWASSLPVLMTDQCNLPEGFTEDAAIRIGSEQESIADGITKLCSMRDEHRCKMGRNGLGLVLRSFSWPAVANQMLAVYRWLTNQGPKPDFVFC